MASQDDVVTVDLPAPEGWVKKYTPSKSGTPRKNEVVFISPTGEEIKSKRQLEQYLKSHPQGPVLSEFDWGTGDTPRRSSRLSEKSKANDAPAPTTQSPKKKQRKSSAKKGAEDNKIDAADAKGDAEDTLFDGKDGENKEVSAVEKADVEGGGKKTDGDVTLIDELKESVGVKVDESNEAIAEIDVTETNEPQNASVGVKVDESNEVITETDVAATEEPKNARDSDNDKTEKVSKDPEKSREEKPDENEPFSEEPASTNQNRLA